MHTLVGMSSFSSVLPLATIVRSQQKFSISARSCQFLPSGALIGIGGSGIGKELWSVVHIYYLEL